MCAQCRYPIHKLRRDSNGEQTFRTEDDSLFNQLATVYTNANPGLAKRAGCGDKTPSGVIHGAEWMPREGALMDYLYYQHGVLMVRLSSWFSWLRILRYFLGRRSGL